ncbi:hypothetical protein ACFYVL_15365 [Streptomyces sp. NPDC004111]|uniref:hypothetical protein n=1 Tax=Streptomyces sp. NPDC004111 TaxID=3364690 RepID=UPI00369D23EB
MTYFMYDVQGNAVDEPSAETIRTLVVDGLAEPEAANPEVSLTHESGWSLTAFAGGLMLWENVEEAEEGADGGSHALTLDDVAAEEAARLFALLAAGEVEKIAGLGWQQTG